MNSWDKMHYLAIFVFISVVIAIFEIPLQDW